MLKFVFVPALVFLFFINSCRSTDSNNDSSEIIQKYYSGLNQSDYKVISECIGDSFGIIAGDWKAKYSKKEYYDWFQWDSVFSPEYKILDIKKRNDSIIVSISKTCNRIRFLHQKPVVLDRYFKISNGKIISSEELSYKDADWVVWENNRTTLEKWIDKNYPEYSNFLSVQNKEYGERYMKLINLYLEKEN